MNQVKVNRAFVFFVHPLCVLYALRTLWVQVSVRIELVVVCHGARRVRV